MTDLAFQIPGEPSLVAFDPGTDMGWAVVTGDRWDSGVWNLKGGRFEGGGMRFLRARRWVQTVLDNVKPAEVVFEEVRRHMGVDAAHIYGGIVAVITSECETRGIPYRAIPVGTVKKCATGKGNADKAAMLAAARLRWPEHAFASDDEADARWIAVAAGKP